MRGNRSYGKLIKQINDTLEKHANNSLRGHDLTMSQLSALIELDQLPEKQTSFKELERILHVAQSTTAGIITRLEQKGMVESFGDAADKRIKNVKITPLGEQQCEDAKQNMVASEALLLSGLTRNEQDALYGMLLKICNTLK